MFSSLKFTFVPTLSPLPPPRLQLSALAALDATYPLGRRTRRLVRMLFR